MTNFETPSLEKNIDMLIFNAGLHNDQVDRPANYKMLCKCAEPCCVQPPIVHVAAVAVQWETYIPLQLCFCRRRGL
jgi:hypothetical protein